MKPVAGVDIGSVAVKAVILLDGRIVARALTPTGPAPAEAAGRALADALQTARLARDDLARVCATGYGRRTAGLTDHTVTEITAAARGAAHLCPPPVRAIIDLGGQDTKVISLDARGRVADFTMNDRCAAGTGKFLEVMAQVLGVSLQELAALAARARNASPLSATCTVFAESEVISRIHRGAPREDVAASLHRTIALKIAAMLKPLRGQGNIAFVGGVARNPAMRRALETALDRPLTVPPHPQFVIAAGAALVAARRTP